jgi:CubicO group peptidase (beta-lactamase class C family)
MPQSNIVVYHSEGERVFDQWLWHGGGWSVMVWLLPAIIIAALLYLTARDYLSKPAWKRPRIW